MQKAFDVHAFNYIVKPAGEERLSMILSEINELYTGDGSKVHISYRKVCIQDRL